MATFTITLKDLLKMEHGIISDYEYDGSKIGLGSYPIFDESYRDRLNSKIIEHFWNREIGQETGSMFKLALRRKMNEIMPLYNQHYVLNLQKIDPLSTVSLKTLTEGDGTSSNTSSSDSTSNAKSRTVSSDTPQNMLSGNSDYASSATDNVSETDGTGTATGSQTDHNSSNSETSGFQGHAPELVYRARQMLVNVDMMVITELESLFMLLWDNGDEYFNHGGYFFV